MGWQLKNVASLNAKSILSRKFDMRQPSLRHRTCTDLAFVAFAFLSTLSANSQEVVKLWPGEPAGLPAVTNGDEYDSQKPSDNLIAGKTVMKIANVKTPEIHIYRPAADKANGASCVICPGGGFNILAWDLEGTEVAEWLNSIGVTAIILKYRVPTRTHGDAGRYEGPVNDTQRALSYVRSRADEWKIDKDKVGVLGFSAGGVTAAVAAIRNGQRQYEAIDEVDQNSCRADWAVLVYSAYMAGDDGKIRPEFAIDDKVPPMFLVHAQDDPVSCQSSIALFMALRDAKVPADLHIFSQGGHGYGLRPSEDPVTTWPGMAATWLKVQNFVPK